jgi:hypothetical protein
MSHGIILSQVLYRVNSGALVGPAIFVTKLFEQLAQILKHGVFFVRARTISKKSSLHRSNACLFHLGPSACRLRRFGV